ncbi:MAG: tetratricopeptide repeat protein [Desulfuromonadales bacterium]|nr:tetratricopeptide repeat protein [Desulfuromonadales bacterium]
MRRTLSLLILGTVLFGCAGPAGQTRGGQTHYLLGVSYLQEQNPTLALNEFLQAEAFDSQDPEIQAALGQTYQLKKAYAEAEKHYLRALRLKQNDPQIQNNLASLYLDMQRWDDAIRYFRQAAGNLLFTRQVLALTGIGYAHQQKGEHLEAVVVLQKALEQNANAARTRFLLGESYYALGNTDLAAQEYRRALHAAPDYVQAHFRLGLAYVKLGDKELAAASLREVVRLAPGTDLGEQAISYLRIIK